MNCSNCGTEIPVEERYCRNCGREVEWLAPTIYAGASAPPQAGSRATEQFDPMQTESMTPDTQTAWDWTPPPALVPPQTNAPPERKSLLMPITVASIVIALVSIGALVYFIMSKDKVAEQVPTNPEKPQPTASPIASTTPAAPSPTATPTPSPTPTPTPNNLPPPGARLAYCNDTNVYVRIAPDLDARPVTKISRGQQLWVIATSTNYQTWNGINSNWTQVQIYNSTVRGWVFSPFVSY